MVHPTPSTPKSASMLLPSTPPSPSLLGTRTLYGRALHNRGLRGCRAIGTDGAPQSYRVGGGVFRGMEGALQCSSSACTH